MMPKRAKAHNPFRKVVRQHFAARAQRLEQQRHKSRFNAHQRGYTREWRKVSRAFLQANPVCSGFDSLCEERGLVRPSTEVDHVIPHRGNMRLFWDQTNWQGLCHTCHCRKTAREDGGFGRPVATRADRDARRAAKAQHGTVVSGPMLGRTSPPAPIRKPLTNKGQRPRVDYPMGSIGRNSPPAKAQHRSSVPGSNTGMRAVPVGPACMNPARIRSILRGQRTGDAQ